MLRSESSSRTWIDSDGLRDKGCVYSPSDRTSLRIRNVPLAIGSPISTAIGPSWEWKKGGGREAIRHITVWHESKNYGDDRMKTWFSAQFILGSNGRVLLFHRMYCNDYQHYYNIYSCLWPSNPLSSIGHVHACKIKSRNKYQKYHSIPSHSTNEATPLLSPTAAAIATATPTRTATQDTRATKGAAHGRHGPVSVRRLTRHRRRLGRPRW